MSSRKKKPAQKPVGPTLVYNDKDVPAGSALHAVFSKLAALGEGGLAAAAALIDMLAPSDATANKLAMMQSQLDRMEGRLLDLAKSGAAKPPEPGKPAQKKDPRPARKPSKAAKGSVTKELAELEETVEQRQARMAKMEKDEKRKALALKKKQDEIKAKMERETPKKPSKAAGAGEGERPEQKKKPRRRRKPAQKTPKETSGTT